MKSILYSVSLACLGLLTPQIGWSDDNVPKADLLDVVFNDDGSAYDTSPMENNIEVIGKDRITTYYSDDYKLTIPQLLNPWGGTGSSYYKIDYSSNQTFKDGLADGHTLELLVKADYTGSLSDAEYKPFSSHQSGGTGLMLAKTAKSANGTNDFTFLPHTGGSYRWAVSGVHPEPGLFYHVVGVYNKEKAKAYIYVNGELKDSVDAPGDFTFPADGSNWFGIGADPSGDTGNTAWNGEVAIARVYNDPLTAEQISALYEKVNVGVDYRQILKNSLDSIASISETFPEGSNPGYYATEALGQYKTIYDDILLKAQNAVEEEASTDEEYIALRQEVLKALNDLHAQANPLTDGYYTFVNGYAAFESTTGKQMAMGVNANKELSWTYYDTTNPLQIFKVTKTDDGNYTIQNVASGQYINTIEGTSKHIPMTDDPTTPQVFTLLHSGQWNITSTTNENSYHTESHNSGAGTSGYIVAWPGGVGSASCWILNPVTDQDLIDRAGTEGGKVIAANKLQELVNAAKVTRDLANEYAPLIKNASDKSEDCQFSSNAKETQEGSFSALIDNNINTFFHSFWSEAGPSSEHNLQVDMLTPQEGGIFFSYKPRQSDFLDCPNNVDIYVTNDETLGSDANSDNESWTKVAHLDSGFPTTKAGSYTSPVITLEQPSRYFRMVVYGTASGRTNSTSGFNYFTMSEFQLYNATPTANSEYNTVAGMKEAADALDAVIKSCEEKIANLTATMADTTELLAAQRAVSALYIDRDALDAEFASVLASAQTAYNDAMGSKLPLITNATDDDPNCQLSSNAKTTKEGSYANLIDGDATTIFHTEWELLEPGEGVYHNLQVDLKGNATNSFFYEFTSRGSGQHDTPNHFNIYATNNADLGTDAFSDDAEWTLIEEVNDETIENTTAFHYTSHVITMDDSYRYIRFTVIGTTDMNNGRMNNTTGVPYFNLGEFQMYTGVDPNRVQYNYNPDVKTATDALKELIDKGETKGWHEVWQADIDELNAALEKLQEAYVDTTALVQLTNSMNAYIANTYVDEEAIGCVKSEEAVTTFSEAIKAARAQVDPYHPTKETVNKATEDINAAYATFMESMNKIVPNKWYYIVSKSTYSYCAGKAMFLNSTNVGTAVSFGQYDAETEESSYEDDAYAMWRIVPIEGTEYYGIQNMCTSHFFGPTVGKGTDYRPLLQSQPSPYRIDYIGKGQLQMVSINDKNPDGYQLHAQQDGSVIVPWPTGLDGASCWTFKPVEDEAAATILIKQNSIRIQTLPFDIPAGDASLMNLNNDLNTYAIKSLTVDAEANTTTIELTTQEEVKAGVPFIMTYGDYTQYDDETSLYDRYVFAVPENVDTMAYEANGLVGTLNGLTLSKSGFGYITNDGLKVTTGEEVSIIGQRGYIDPAKVVPAEGETTLTLTLEGGLINGLRPINVAKASDKVNVYSIDGKLLKKNVKATEAQKSLKKGIYIIGKKKVAVK